MKFMLTILPTGWFWIAVARFFRFMFKKYQTKFSCMLVYSQISQILVEWKITFAMD
jgi:hypothetical protein